MTQDELKQAVAAAACRRQSPAPALQLSKLKESAQLGAVAMNGGDFFTPAQHITKTGLGEHVIVRDGNVLYVAVIEEAPRLAQTCIVYEHEIEQAI